MCRYRRMFQYRQIFLEIYILNYVVNVMNDVIIKFEFPKFTFSYFYMNSFDRVFHFTNYTSFELTKNSYKIQKRQMTLFPPLTRFFIFRAKIKFQFPNRRICHFFSKSISNKTKMIIKTYSVPTSDELFEIFIIFLYVIYETRQMISRIIS